MLLIDRTQVSVETTERSCLAFIIAPKHMNPNRSATAVYSACLAAMRSLRVNHAALTDTTHSQPLTADEALRTVVRTPRRRRSAEITTEAITHLTTGSFDRGDSEEEDGGRALGGGGGRGGGGGDGGAADKTGGGGTMRRALSNVSSAEAMLALYDSNGEVKRAERIIETSHNLRRASRTTSQEQLSEEILRAENLVSSGGGSSASQS